MPQDTLIKSIPLSRRAAIARFGGGLGTLGLLASLPQQVMALPEVASPARTLPHFRPRAKRVIHLFMNGGPFGPDFFDPKPDLTKFAGQRPEGADLRTERPTGGLLPVPFKFQPHGKSGLPVSDLLPLTAQFADDLCVLRVSFVKTLALMRTLWLTLKVGGDLLSTRQKEQLTERFLERAGRLVTRRRKRPRHGPRAVRQPVSRWPRLRRNQAWAGSVRFQLLPS